MLDDLPVKGGTDPHRKPLPKRSPQLKTEGTKSAENQSQASGCCGCRVCSADSHSHTQPQVTAESSGLTHREGIERAEVPWYFSRGHEFDSHCGRMLFRLWFLDFGCPAFEEGLRATFGHEPVHPGPFGTGVVCALAVP